MAHNLSHAAKVVLDYRRRITHGFQYRALQSALSSDEFAEALQRRWLIEDHETGSLKINDSAKVLLELKQIAEQDGEGDKVEVGDEVVVADNGKSINGVVKEVRPDGKIVLSFGNQRPASGKTEYNRTEVKKKPKNRPFAAATTTTP